MKLIIAGSRDIEDYAILERALAEARIIPEQVDEVVSGRCEGVDTLGETWADNHGIPIKPFEAKWKDLETPPVFIKQGRYGKYNALAGFARNQRMADYADALLCVIYNSSPGSTDMIERMQKAGKDVFIYEV